MDSTLIGDEQRKMSIQNSIFRKRLRLEEPLIKKPNTTKPIACCLFGVPDATDCQNYARQMCELTAMEFQERWNFDPNSGEPINSDELEVGTSSMEMEHESDRYRWKKIIDENQIISSSIQLEEVSAFPKKQAIALPVSSSVCGSPNETKYDKPNSNVELSTQLEPLKEGLERSTNIDDLNSSSGDHNSSLETTSPSYNKQTRPLRQCRITEYMKVTKKNISHAKKLR